MSDSKKSGMGCLGKGCVTYIVLSVLAGVVSGIGQALQSVRIDEEVWKKIGIIVGIVIALIVAIFILVKIAKRKKLMRERALKLEHERELQNAIDLKKEISAPYLQISNARKDVSEYKLEVEYRSGGLQTKFWKNFEQAVASNSQLLSVVENIDVEGES